MIPIHPSEPEHFRQRNELLQKCLRPEPLPFAIEEEYPIVLAPEGREFSYCGYQDAKICSHVNLWPRRILDTQGREVFRVGLVGNVATDASVRGLGLMRNMLKSLDEVATKLGLCALILWSDLESFYHKLDYQSLGREFRFLFHAQKLIANSAARFRRVDTRDIDNRMLEQLLALRYPLTLRLERSVEEFMSLIQIPWLDLYLAEENAEPIAYALTGKGYDMIGIIHEWGGKSPDLILALMRLICEEHEFQQIMLLSPAAIDELWHRDFSQKSEVCEEMPMAWVKVLDKTREKQLQDLFIWGLDSI